SSLYLHSFPTRRSSDLDNIVFWPWSIAQRFVADGHQVHWVEVGRLPSPAMTELSLAALINSASASGAVVHLHTGMAEQTSGDKRSEEHTSELQSRENLV